MAASGNKHTPARFPTVGSRAFTLVELLVVVCIILVLTGLLMAGLRHVHRIAATKETLADLHVCRGMLQEYENRTGLAGIEAYSSTNPPQQTDPNSPVGTPQLFPVFVDPWPVLNSASTTMMYHPSAPFVGTYWPFYEINDVISGVSTMDTTATARYACNAVLDTREVMYLLMRVPANRTTLQSIQSKRILEAAPGGPPTTIDQGPVLLDGWGNPIIFVPRGGMYVYMTDYSTNPPGKTLFVVRSTGLVKFTGTLPPLNGSERPFWASAGEDGDFTQGDDNLYSFQD